MMFILDWFNLDEFLPIIVLMCLLMFVGGQMTRPDSETYMRARRITAAVFLLYAVMAVYSWGPSTPAEFVVVILRASLAAGVLYGVAVVTLTPAMFLIEQAKTLMPQFPEPKPVESQQETIPPDIPIRDSSAKEREENERMSKIEDARTLAAQFYEEHAALLEETLPAALFKSRMHTRFPESVTTDQAWQSAQEMIAEMIPIIAKSREQMRAEVEEQRKRAEEAREDERNRKEIEDRVSAFQKLAEWYLREQEIIKQSLPEGDDRDDALGKLFERYDTLMKETYAEMKP